MQKYSAYFKERFREAIILLLLVCVAFVMEAWNRTNVLEKAKSAESGISVSVIIPSAYEPPEEPAPPTEDILPGGGGGGGGGITPISASATVIFQGIAQPRATITLKKNGAVAANFLANEKAEFHKTLTGLTPGIYNFSLFSTDEHGRNSITLNFRMEAQKNTQTTASNIFIPPTIELDKKQVAQNEPLYLYGQTVPNAWVNIFIDEIKISKLALADKNGNWSYWFETTDLALRDYSVKAKGITTQGRESKFGQSLPFFIVLEKKICGIADFNCDDTVDLVDFSILLYWWKRPDVYLRPQVDLNRDRIVNLVDFSIMLYYWKK